MKRLIPAVCLSMLLVGCNQEPRVASEAVRVDVAWPNPIGELASEWEVVSVNGQPYVGMPFEQFQTGFRPWLNDVKRYMKDSKSMICYYRTPLNEPKCNL